MLETRKSAINFGCDTFLLFLELHTPYFDLRALHLSRINTFHFDTSSHTRWNYFLDLCAGRTYQFDDVFYTILKRGEIPKMSSRESYLVPGMEMRDGLDYEDSTSAYCMC